ncbi:hypothetical protein EV702DRAFT_1053773 [Suillus placidus]|uniref:Uncharacterized protein n=1 Tax=Suillus placidus TaxID=48579 RepID=A0A9P7CVB8_9AGAM|nr:hypothetical protein EV702DRAFT_1053773 [Suillus placidus]
MPFALICQMMMLMKIIPLLAMVLILMAKIIPHVSAPPYYMVSTARVRDEAKFHPVQLGMISTAMAGTTTKRITGQRRWQRRLDQCNVGLPHERFVDKVSVHRLSNDRQNGSHPTVLHPIKDAMVVFKPDMSEILAKHAEVTSSRNASSSKRTLKDLDWDDDSRISSSVDEGGSKKRVRQSN